MQTTEELIHLAKQRKRIAFAELVRRYERTVTVSAWSVVGDFHLAQDVAQDSFVIAYKKLDQLRDAASFGPWLLSIVQRESLRVVKRRDRTKTEIALPTESLSGTDDRQKREAFEEVIPLLASLPEHERTVVVMRYFDGHSVQEIADGLARPVGTVTKQLSRALQRMRNVTDEVEK